jgi:hypothetical protein
MSADRRQPPPIMPDEIAAEVEMEMAGVEDRDAVVTARRLVALAYAHGHASGRRVAMLQRISDDNARRDARQVEDVVRLDYIDGTSVEVPTAGSPLADIIGYEVTIRTETAPGVHLFHPTDVRIVRRGP